MKTPSAIAKVIESCLDDERTLLHESKLVDEKRSAVLTRLADERHRFSEELERLSGRPVARGNPGSWTELVRELGNRLYVGTWGRNTGDAIQVCRRSQHRTDLRYESALKLEWPSELAAALVKQHERVHAAGQELSSIEY